MEMVGEYPTYFSKRCSWLPLMAPKILCLIGSTLTITSPASGSVSPTTLSTGGPSWTSGGILSSAGGFPVFDKINIQTFSSSGTYTPTTGMVYCVIECWGGGGGGAGLTGNGSISYASGGGGAGGYSRKTVTKATVGSSQTVTIGALGAGGSGNANGSAGGTTSVGSICIANGGSGGGYSASYVGLGGAGGTAGTGDIAAPGMNGGTTGNSGATTPVNISGFGGSTLVGQGGAGVGIISAGTINGNSGTGYGAGGSGGAATGNSGSVTGGSGTAGYVIITEYLSA